MGGFRIQRRLLAAFLALLAMVTIPAAILLERWLGRDLQDLVRESLEREAAVLAAELERAPPADLPAWVTSLEKPAAARLTLIALDGRVLADSDVAVRDLAQLENHATRPEVRAALGGHPGSHVRQSATVLKDMIYVAVPVGAPPRLVLRLALPLTQVADTVGRAHTALWLSGLIALGLALALGVALTRWLSRPVLAMTRAARAMTHGDFSVALPDPPDDELGDLVHAVDTLRTQLAARIEELRNEGAKLRTILNGMSEGVALVQGGAIAVANPAFATLLGVAHDVEGRAPLEAARVPELGEVIRGATVERKDASREVQVGGRSLLLQAHPLGTGGAAQAVVAIIDMSEARRIERLRRDFVANASHELRTPVAAIVGVAETLAAGASEDPEARASFVDILLRHAQRLSRLTSDLLDIARLEAGYRARVESVPVREVIDSVLAALGSRAVEKNLTLSVESPAGLTVAAERAALEQILTNLVENALKYTPDGKSVKVSAEPRGTSVLLTVEDTGPGIPAEHLPRLFERFYRVDNARSRELGGTGLGLAIVKHLVLANGGEIRVDSALGRGTTFFVSLHRS